MFFFQALKLGGGGVGSLLYRRPKNPRGSQPFGARKGGGPRSSETWGPSQRHTRHRKHPLFQTNASHPIFTTYWRACLSFLALGDPKVVDANVDVSPATSVGKGTGSACARLLARFGQCLGRECIKRICSSQLDDLHGTASSSGSEATVEGMSLHFSGVNISSTPGFQ